MVQVTMSRVSLLLVCLLLGYASSDGHGHYPSSLHYPTSHINSHYPTDHHGGSHLVDAVDILFSNSGIQRQDGIGDLIQQLIDFANQIVQQTLTNPSTLLVGLAVLIVQSIVNAIQILLAGTTTTTTTINCGGTLTADGIMQTDGYTSTYSGSSCVFTITPGTATEIRLTFDDFVNTQPSSGTCGNETIAFSGMSADHYPGTSLCGTLTGTNVVLGVTSGTDIKVTLTANANPSVTKAKITVKYYTASGVTDNCDTWYEGTSGSIQSFAKEEMINSQDFNYCIAPTAGQCAITYSSTAFQMGGTQGSCTADYLKIGSTNYCGSSFTSLTVNGTGTAPYMLPFKTDATNTAMDDGFLLSWATAAC